MAWLCTSSDSKSRIFGKSQMCIVTGPNIDIATKLIKRLKGIFDTKLGPTFNNKETVLELSGCRIEAFPSNHIDSFRALDNPKFILLDESDFWRKSEIDNVRHVSERYIGKSDPFYVQAGGTEEKIRCPNGSLSNTGPQCSSSQECPAEPSGNLTTKCVQRWQRNSTNTIATNMSSVTNMSRR